MQMKEWKIAFMAKLEFSKWSPEKIVDALDEIGYDGVEWTLSHFNPRKKSLEELKSLTQLTRTKMEVSELVVQKDFVCIDKKTRNDRIQFVKECIEAAAAADIHVINAFTGPAPWDPHAPRIPRDISEGAAWTLVLDAFNEVIEEAEKHHVHIAVEAVFGHLCHDYYTLKELLDNISSKYLAVNMDPSHFVLYRNDISWVIKRLGNKIKHVHLKDVVGKPGLPRDDFLFPLLGEGIVDWRLFFEALREIGYKGFLSVEFESFDYYRNILQSNPVKAADMCMQQVEALLNLV